MYSMSMIRNTFDNYMNVLWLYVYSAGLLIICIFCKGSDCRRIHEWDWVGTTICIILRNVILVVAVVVVGNGFQL